MAESLSPDVERHSDAALHPLHRRQIQSLINNIVGVWIRRPGEAESELDSFIAAFRWKAGQDRSPGSAWNELANYLQGVRSELDKLDEIRGDDLDPRSLWNQVSTRITTDAPKDPLQPLEPQRARVYLAILAALRRVLSVEECEALQQTLRSGVIPTLDPQDAWF